MSGFRCGIYVKMSGNKYGIILVNENREIYRRNNLLNEVLINTQYGKYIYYGRSE